MGTRGSYTEKYIKNESFMTVSNDNGPAPIIELATADHALWKILIEFAFEYLLFLYCSSSRLFRVRSRMTVVTKGQSHV